MLYVFHVDTGTMMTFDMNLAMEKVSSLQGVISRGCRIPEEKQVLLISGGESLDPSAIVGKYHAGTDTNPIFLFSKTTIEAATPPSPSVNYGSDIDLQGQVEGSLLMPPAYETVISRAQLALQFQEVDSEEMRACERLIHDQHLQQQGWAAVVANLEDVTTELRQRSETFHDAYVVYLENRPSYRSLLASVSESIQLLSKIPVLSCLERSCDGTESATSSTPTLFDWISSQDTNHTLHDMVEQCDKATEQLDMNVGDALKSEVDQLFKEVHNDSMKEVKGLEDRLYGLDQIISGARKVLQDQADLAQGFVHNQNRLSNVRDRSILPDLCSSHRGQLVEMLKNHTRIRDIKKKCRMAKEELSVNLHTRLRWVMYVEKKICDVDGKLTIYLGNLKRLRKRLDILQQVHDAPKVYAQLLVEVVRRRKFSGHFITWACNLAGDSSRLHTEESRRREAFLMDIGHHFLQSMFQGLEDYPPPFATAAPAEFDHDLPAITVDDICLLKKDVPELSGLLSVPAEEDLYADLTCVKDTSLQWVEKPFSRSLKNPTPGASDSDVVQGERPVPYSLDGGSISLGDQFTECEAEEEIIQRAGFEPLSPPDKEFLLPKSLSEELTAEMKAEQKRLRQKSGDVKLTTDGVDGKNEDDKVAHDPTSITNQIQVQGTRSRKSSSTFKTGVDVSPDMGMSQEFTTADFYIDESLPSSIESPPKTSSEGKQTFEQMLIEEKQVTEKLQSDLKLCNTKLSAKDNKLGQMKAFLNERLPQLKDMVKELKNQNFEEISEFKKEFENVKDNLIQVLTCFDRNLSATSQAVIDKQVKEREESELTLQNQIDAESNKCSELEEKVKVLTMQLEEQNNENKAELEKVISAKADLGAKLALDVQQLTLQHELELEVELDKLRSEFVVKIESLEKEIESKDTAISEKEDHILLVKKEKIKLEEDLINKFQKEKEDIRSILAAENEEKLQQMIKQESEKINAIKQEITESLKLAHQNELDDQLNELKQTLTAQKEEAIEMSQSTLMEEHTKATVEIKDKLLEEKTSEFSQLKENLELKLQTDLAKLSAEFNKEKGELIEELDKLKNRPLTSCENQTELSMFNASNCDTQTEPHPVKLETQVQTELLDQSNISMQTDNCEQVQLATQTDTLDSSNLSVQTDKVQQTQLSTQTDKNQVSNIAMQTDQCESNMLVNQSSLPVQKDNQIVDQSSTQTDSIIQSQLATQTEKNTQDQSATQTDSINKSQTATQTKVKDESQVHVQTASLEELQNALKAEHEKQLSELTLKHNDEMEKLVSLLEKGKEDAQQLRSSLTSIAGDKQVQFNEAVNKVCQEKDRVIEEMRNKEREMDTQIKKDQENLEQIKEEKVKAEGIKDRALALLKDKEREFRDMSAQQRHLESELGLAHQQVIQYKEQMQDVSTSSDITESVSAVSSSPSIVKISEGEEVDLQQKIRELEEEVKHKDEELSKMQQKVMELSMSASTRSLIQDKVSITSCHVGDLVLLCLDERLDQYVVFTVGSTLHFLHTDCLQPLGLKTSAGEAKKQWQIAEVTDKEYCQAKKANNRFKVPVGSKFYRVKAKKWSRETTSSPAKKAETTSASTSS